MHLDGPRLERPNRDGGVPHERPEDVRRDARQAGSAPGGIREPGSASAERPRRDREGDRTVCVGVPMNTVTVDVSELPGRFEELVKLAASGTEVILQNGPTTAKLV